jgi:replicative DNA helicase
VSTTEYKLLAALRSEQNHHIVWKINPELFTDSRIELFDAYRVALERYHNLSIDSVEHIYKKELPSEVIVPLSIDPEPLIDKLHTAYVSRKMYDLGQEFIAASKRGEGLNELLRNAIHDIQRPKEPDASLNSGISEFLSDFSSKYRGDYTYISTGLPFLDNMMGGEWCRSEISIITGASGGGKSAIMGNSALAMALKGIPVLIFSLEMPKRVLIGRWVSSLAEVDSKIIRAGRETISRAVSSDKLDRIDQALKTLQNLPLYIIDTPAIDANYMSSIIRQYHRDYGVQAFFVDYLQIMGFDHSLGKHYGLSAGLLTLVQAAKDLNIAGIILAQRHADDKRIKDSGDAIQHTAVHIDIEIIQDSDELGVHIANLEYHKNRHGPLGKTTVLYNGKHLSFIANAE